MTAVGGLAPGSELIADYMLPEHMRDEAGAMYGMLVAQASAERGEPWLSSFTPAEMTDLGRENGFAAGAQRAAARHHPGRALGAARLATPHGPGHAVPRHGPAARMKG